MAASRPSAPSFPSVDRPRGSQLVTSRSLGTPSQFWGLAREEGAAGAGSGQGIEVHSNQRLPPVAEVAVFRAGQVCAGATGHRWEEELNHLAQPLIPVGRTGSAPRA